MSAPAFALDQRVTVQVGTTTEPRELEGTVVAIEESRTRGHRYAVDCGPRDYWIVGPRKIRSATPVACVSVEDRPRVGLRGAA